MVPGPWGTAQPPWAQLFLGLQARKEQPEGVPLGCLEQQERCWEILTRLEGSRL